MKKPIKQLKIKHLDFFKKIKEYTALIAVLTSFFIAPLVLRWIDPTTATFDPGVLHSISVALVAYAIYQLIAWSVLKTLWKAVGDYMKSGLWANDFKDMDKKTKVLLSLGLYFSLFLMLVLLTIAIL